MAGSSDAVARLRSGAEQIVPDDGLEAKLALGRPLRIKFGVDPSRPDLHLGHAVPLRKLRQFQDAGHVAVLIIGDFTGRVGDPSGRSETRPLLAADETEANAATYLEQAGRVLDMDAAEVRRNSEWLARMGMDDVLRLASTATVAQMLERDDFQQRHREGKPISVVEFLYPLLQGFDSVVVDADVELGGTDQTFNLLMGRELQRQYGADPQVVMTVPLLEGTDGRRKMSKSFDNVVGLTDPPDEMFGRLMRIPDELIAKYLRLATTLDGAEVDRIDEGLAEGSLHPGEEKRRLAREVVGLYHGPGAGAEAEREFDRRHKQNRIPATDVPSKWVSHADVIVDGEVDVGALLWSLGLAESKSHGRRLIDQEGVRCRWPHVAEEQGERITAHRLPLGESSSTWEGSVWSVGKRRFVRLEGFRRE
jgi:tyrosyl-tRNA synthetase